MAPRPFRRVLGVDPGSRVTGYGVVELAAAPVHVDHGCLQLGGGSMAERLGALFMGLSRVIEATRPDYMAIEAGFVHRNPSTALKLGQARGAALCAAAVGGLRVSEHSPRQVKQAVTGYGAAAKSQVQLMVARLLDLPEVPAADAADALAVALCHCQSERMVALVAAPETALSAPGPADELALPVASSPLAGAGAASRRRGGGRWRR